jgi:hypothetical protein
MAPREAIHNTQQTKLQATNLERFCAAVKRSCWLCIPEVCIGYSKLLVLLVALVLVLVSTSGMSRLSQHGQTQPTTALLACLAALSQGDETVSNRLSARFGV